jgi:guanylate kinase
MTTRILLILGVSGVGKSTLIKEVVGADARFLPVSAYTTRPARADDQYRISVSQEEFDFIERTELLLAANEVCGHRYGTSKKRVLEVQKQGHVPILDCPLLKVDTIEREFLGQLFRVYVEPPSCQTLWGRLQDGRDPDGRRYRAACMEIAAVKTGAFANQIDFRVVNCDGMVKQTAEQVCQQFWKAAQSGWPDPEKCKLKNDRYRNSRGGRAVLLDIVCSRCYQKVVLYQKDGKGGLHRLYLNRIFAPDTYAKLQFDPSIRTTSNMPNLVCRRCHSVIGTPMLHWEGRLAFRLIAGSYAKKQVGG